MVRLLSGVFNVRTPFRMLAYTGSLLYICLIWRFCLTSSKQERIGCVMVSVLYMSAIDHEFKQLNKRL